MGQLPLRKYHYTSLVQKKRINPCIKTIERTVLKEIHYQKTVIKYKDVAMANWNGRLCVHFCQGDAAIYPLAKSQLKFLCQIISSQYGSS